MGNSSCKLVAIQAKKEYDLEDASAENGMIGT